MMTTPYARPCRPLGIALTAAVVLTLAFSLPPAASGGGADEPHPLREDALTYRIEEVPLPDAMSPEVSAITFTPAGRLVAANRHGEVWIRESREEGAPWRRFAYGLHEPLGIRAEDEDVIYVSHRPEVTRLTDASGDGFADTYETVAEDWTISDNWHEHSFGLPRDSEGNLIMALGLPDPAGPLREIYPRQPLDRERVLDENKLSAGPWQGWLMKVTPDGDILPWANGFRQPAGVALSPGGEIFVTDQHGDWIASSNLIHVRQGRFYGHPASLKWDERYADEEITIELLEQMRTPEAVVLPHGSLGGSPGEPVWDTTGGEFGPFAGQVFIGDFTRLLIRVDLEEVAGAYQGAAFPFIRDAVGAEDILAFSGGDHVTIPAGREGHAYFQDVPPRPGTRLRQGSMRMAFAPDGSLYLGQTTRGWAYGGDGIQRVVWTGRTPVEVETMRLREDGFTLRFTTAMDADKAGRPESYRLRRFRYLYNARSGSPRVDEAEVAVVEASVSEGGERVDLHIAPDDLLPGFIYRLDLHSLADGAGRPVENPLAYYTANRLVTGERFTGRPSQRLFEEPQEDADADAGPDLHAGRQLYATYCIACHQPDGRGGEVPGFAAPDLTGDDSPLRTQSDDELAAAIAGEAPADDRTMPAFGNVLSDRDLRDLLAFMREAFQ